MFTFTPLLGAQSSSQASQSLLEFDGGIKILIDVGWDEDFDGTKLRELEKQVPTISFILLTHATVSHIAAFAHCCKHFPLFTRIPIYATTPVISLGRTLLQDLYASTPLASSFVPSSALAESAYTLAPGAASEDVKILLPAPTAEEIAGYFSLIHPLKYSQPHQPLPSPFSPSLNGLTVTAYSAGHTLGGTIWHIQHGLESVVYAVDWNQAREHVLSGAAWLGGAGASGGEVIEQLRRPTALVCSSRGAEHVAVAGGLKRRDDHLLKLIRDTVSHEGSVLIPCDSSARMLELAYLLEGAWQEAIDEGPQSPLINARLFLASRTCGATMRYARSMLEWMEESIVRDFEGAGGATLPQGTQRKNVQHSTQTKQGLPEQEDRRSAGAPFDFKHLKLLERRSQVNRVLTASVPRVILASDSSIEWGFSKQILQALSGDSQNLVILPHRIGHHHADKKGCGRALWELWNTRTVDEQNADHAMAIEANGTEITVDRVETAPLVGIEISIYQQYLARQRQLQETLQMDGASTLETSADVVDDRSSSTSSSSDDSEVDRQGKVLNVTATLSHSRHKIGLTDAELGIGILVRRRGIHDFDVRGKKGRDKMFPFVAKRKRGDDFGDIIRPEEYLRAEEREDTAGEAVRDSSARKESVVGQKRKWEDIAARTGAGSRRLSNGTGKRRRPGETANGLSGPAELENEGGSNLAAEDDQAPSEDEIANSLSRGPCKAWIAEEKVRINLRVGFVDFTGLHDRRTLQMLIPLIRPRKLILVGGEPTETMALAADCHKLLTSRGDSGDSVTEIFTPTVGLSVDASVDTNAWVVKLSRTLFKKLRWQQVRGLGVVALTASLEATEENPAADEENAKKRMKINKGEETPEAQRSSPDTRETAATPVLDVVPANLASATRSAAQPLHVGDLRLADLRKLMLASGFSAEFRGEGTLLIDGIVAVRKSGSGKIEVEGGGLSLPLPRRLEGTFYAVKRRIYEGLALVAGG